MKKLNISIETYDYDGTYYIDIVTSDDKYEAWIYDKDTSQKFFAFGIAKRVSYDSFISMVKDNAEDYIQIIDERDE